MNSSVDLRHPAPEQQRNLTCFPEIDRPDQDSRERFVACQIVLRQGWAFVGRVELLSKKANRSLIVSLSQRNRGLSAGMPGSNDQAVEMWAHLLLHSRVC